MRVTVILIIKTWPYTELSFLRTSVQDLILSYCFQRKWSFVITFLLYDTLYIPGYYAYAVPEEHTIYLTA